MKKLVFSVFILCTIVLCSCKPKEVVIGVVIPETGDAALYGQAIKEGIVVAEKYLQDTQTFPYRLTVIYKDTKSDPEYAQELMNSVIKEGAIAIIGGVTSSEAFKLAEIAGKRNRILMSPSASHTDLTAINIYFHRVYPSDKQEVVQMAKFTAENLGATRAAILSQDNDYGMGVAEDYTRELKKLGIVNTQNVKVAGSSDTYRSEIKEAMENDPDVIYIAAYSDIIIKILKELREEKYPGKIVTTSAINAPGAFARAGEEAEGIYYCKPPFKIDDTDNPVVLEFASTYEESFGKMPGVFSAYGFDSLLVLATAIKNEGTYPEDVYKGIKALQGFKGATGTIVFNTSGDVNKFPRIFWYTNGQEVDWVDYKKKEKERILQEIERLRSQQN